MTGVAIDFSTKNSAKTEREVTGITRALSKLTQSTDKLADKTTKTNSTIQKTSATTTKGFAGTTKAVDGTAAAINSVKNAAITLGASFLAIKGVGTFNQMNDDLISIQNNLRLIIKDSNELIRTQRKLQNLSKDTYSTLSSTTGMYVKLSKSLEKFGLAESRIMKITKTINQATNLSSGGIESKMSGLVQLMQGLGSELRGQELRSVFEQLDYLGFKIMDTFGKTSGEMIKMAESGVLSGMKLVEMFEKMADSTEDDFSRVKIASKQAIMQLKDSFTVMAGEVNQFIGFSERFVKRVLWISEKLGNVGYELETQSYIISTTIKNLVYDFSLFNEISFAVKAAIHFDLDYDKTKFMYRMYSFAKGLQETFNDWFKKEPIEIKPSFISSTKNTFMSEFKAVMSGYGAARSDITDIDERETYRSIRLVELLKDSWRVFFVTLSGITPRFLLPVTSLFKQFNNWMAVGLVDLYSSVYITVIRQTRSIQGEFERLTKYLIFDTRIERSWVNLFTSKSIIEFKNNLDALNKARASYKRDDKLALFSRLKEDAMDYLYPIQKVLVMLGILDTRLIRIQSMRFDRIGYEFEIFGEVVKRILTDVIYPTVIMFVVKMGLALRLFLNTMSASIVNMFREETGVRAAKQLISGVSAVFITFGKTVDDILGKNIFSSIFGDIGKETSLIRTVFETTKSVLSSFGNFLKGFLYTISIDLEKRLNIEGFTEGLISVYRAFVAVMGKILKAIKEMFSSVSSISMESFSTKNIQAVIDKVVATYRKIIDATTEFMDSINFSAEATASIAFLEMLGYALFSVSSVLRLVNNLIEKFKTKAGILAKSLYPLTYSANLLVVSLFAITRSLSFVIMSFGLAQALAPRVLANIAESLPGVAEKFKKFGNSVKDVFLDMYDKIVGHSYWPDTIDGIVAKTEDLKNVRDSIERFGTSVADTFSEIFSTNKSLKFNINFGSSFKALKEVDWAKMFSGLQKQITSIVIAAFMFAFGGPTLKIAAGGFLLSTLDAITGNAIKKILPSIADNIGVVAFKVGEVFAKGMMAAFINVIKNLPELLGGLLSGISPLLGDIVSFLRSIPSALIGLAGFMAGMQPALAIVISMLGNDLVTALLAVGAAYSLVVKGGFGQIKEMFLGKKGTKSKPGKTGFLEMMGLALPATTLNPFAIAAGVAFAASFFDAISASSAAMVGIPMLAMAIMGPKGGVRLIADLLRDVGGWFKTGAKKAGITDWLKSLFATPLGPKTQLASQVKTSIKPQLAAVFAAVKDNIKNFRNNKKAYGEGLIPKSMLFEQVSIKKNEPVVKGPMTNKRILANAVNDLAIATGTAPLFKGMSDIAAKMKIATVGIVKNLKNFVIQIYGASMLPMVGMMGATAGKMQKIAVTLGGLFNRRLLAFVGIDLGITSIVALVNGFDNLAKHISNGDASFGGFIKQVAKTIFWVTALRLAFSAFLKISKAYKLNSLAGESNPLLKGIQSEVEGYKDAYKTVKDKVKDIIGVSSEMGGSLGFGDRFRKSKDLNKAFNPNMSKTALAFAGIKDIFGSIGDTAKRTFNNITKGFFISTAAGTSFQKLLASILLLVKSIGNAFVVLWTKGLWPLLKLIRGLVTTTMIWIAALSTVAIGVGLLTLWLFGPTDSFINNLEWAYDKVRALFGLKPLFRIGKEHAMEETAPRMEVAGIQVDFRDAISKIDFSQMTQSRQDSLANAGKALEDSLKILQERYEVEDSEYAKVPRSGKETYEFNSKLFETRDRELNKLLEGYEKILAKQPIKEGMSYGDKAQQAYKDMTYIDNSPWNIIKRTIFEWKPVLTDADYELSKFTKGLTFFHQNMRSTLGSIVGVFSAFVLGIAGLKFGAALGLVFGPLGVIIGGGLGMLIGGALDALRKKHAGAFDWVDQALADVGITFYDVVFKAWVDAITDGSLYTAEYIKNWLKDNKRELDPETKAKAEQQLERRKSLDNVFEFLPANIKKDITALQEQKDILEKRVRRFSEEGLLGKVTNKLALTDTQSDTWKLRDVTIALEKLENDWTEGGQVLKSIKKVDTRLTKLSTLTEEYTEFGFGKENKDFSGSGQIVSAMENLIVDFKDSVSGLGALDTADKRSQYKGMSESLKYALKETFDFGNGIGNPATRKETISKTLGETLDPLRLDSVANPAMFDTLIVKLKEAQLKLATAPLAATQEQLDLMRKKVLDIKSQAMLLIPKSSTFSAINEQLTALGLTAFKDEQFAAFSPAQIISFTEALSKATEAVRVFKDVEALGLGAGTPEYMKAFVEKMSTKEIVDKAKTGMDLSYQAKPAEGDIGRQLRELAEKGYKPPDDMPKTYANYEKYIQLQNRLNKATADAGRALDTPMKQPAVDIIGTELVFATRAMEVFVATSKPIEHTIDGMLASLNNLSDIGFTTLEDTTKGILKTYSDELETIKRKFDVGTANEDDIKRRAEILRNVSRIQIAEMKMTGSEITDAFNNVGITDARQIVKAFDNGTATRLFEIDKRMKLLKLDESELYSPQYLANKREMLKLDKESADIREKSARTFSSSLSDVNEIFKTSLDGNMFAGMGDAMVSRLSQAAATIKAELAELENNGAGAGIMNSMFEKMKGITKLGSYMSFFQDMRESTENALTEGAKSAFERFSSFTDNLFDFKEFMELPAKFRRELGKEISDIEMIGKAAEIKGLDQTSIDILKGISRGESAADVLTKFEASIGMSLDTKLATPAQKMATASEEISVGVANVAKAIDNLYLAMTGKPVTIKGTEAKQERDRLPVTNPLDKKFYEDLDKAKDSTIAKTVNKTPGIADNLRASLKKAEVADFGKDLYALASKEQLTKALGLSDLIGNKQSEIDATMLAGGNAKPMQLEIAAYKEALETLRVGIDEESVNLKAAGASFREGVKSDMSSALVDLFKGKSDDDEGVFETFFNNLVMSFTDNIISSFSENFTDRLMGKDSQLGKIMEQVGASLFNMVKDIFTSLKGAASGGSSSFNWISTAISGIGAFFGVLGGGSSPSFSARPNYHAAGGLITGPGTGTSDSILSFLSNREFVVNAKSTKKFLPLLEAINAGRLPRFAEGGLATSTVLTKPRSMSSASMSKGRSDSQVINLTITGDISRQTKQEIYKMLPNIADGVNAHNREKGYR
jgi:tape measure domain-containing protein